MEAISAVHPTRTLCLFGVRSSRFARSSANTRCRTFGSSVYTPGYGEVATQFNVSGTAALLGMSLYVLGSAFGPTLAAPLSEMHGRRYVTIISPPLAILFTVGAGFSNTFAALLTCRFFTGFFGSPVIAVGMGTQADLFPPNMIAPATAVFLLAPFLGPCLGPVVGGFAAEYKGWRWTQWCMLFVTLAVFVIGFSTQETYKKAILRKRAKKLGLLPPPLLSKSKLGSLRVSRFRCWRRTSYHSKAGIC